MTEKVVLTRKQADAIEIFLTENDNDKEHFINWFGFNRKYRESINDNYKPFSDLTFSELSKALLIGYEVKPEFEAGEWVVWE